MFAFLSLRGDPVAEYSPEEECVLPGIVLWCKVLGCFDARTLDRF